MILLSDHNRVRRILLALLAGATLLALFAAVSSRADAHANQIKSSPSPNSELEVAPDRVIVWFSESIEESFSELTVLNAAADRVDLNDSSIDSSEPSVMSVSLPPLENGTYTVVWKNLSSIDGHKVVGSFVFAVGESLSAHAQIYPDEQPLLQTVVDPWLRWLIFISVALVIGGLTFEMLIGIPTIYSDPVKQRWVSAAIVASTFWSRIAVASMIVLILALLGQILQAVSLISGSFSLIPDFGILKSVVLESGWGRFWMYRAIVAIGMGMMFYASIRMSRSDDIDEENQDKSAGSLVGDSPATQVVIFLGLVFLGLTAMSGHNAASPVEIRTLAIATDFVHLVASIVWSGGVIYLTFSVPIFIKHLGKEGASKLFEKAIDKFTVLGVISAGILVITGLFSSYMQVTNPVALATPYGWFLVAKLVLLIPLFTIAGFNGFKLVRRFSSDGQRLLGRSLVAESLIVLLVFITVGWLASLEPARQYAGRMGIGVSDAVVHTDRDTDTHFDVTIHPAEVGENDVTVQLSEPGGTLVQNAVDVRVRLKFVDDDLGEQLVSLEEDEGGRVWRLKGARLDIAGEYQAEVVVLRSDSFDARTAFRFTVFSSDIAADTIEPDTNTANLLFGLQLLIIGGLVAAVAFRGIFTSSVFSYAGVQWSLLTPGSIVVALGLFMLLNVQVLRIGFPENVRNPFPPTSESVAIGEPIYVGVCASCHGDNGLGDGLASVALENKPSDLSVHVPLHSDTILYEFIRDGIGVGMPAQGDLLSEDEMWHLVNYLRAKFDNR